MADFSRNCSNPRIILLCHGRVLVGMTGAGATFLNLVLTELRNVSNNVGGGPRDKSTSFKDLGNLYGDGEHSITCVFPQI